MSSEFSITVHVASDVEQIRNRIVEHTIIFPPPYDIAVNDIVRPYRAPHGRTIKIIITHGNRDVNIVDSSIRHHVLRTAILSYQNHQLRPMMHHRHMASLRPLPGRRPIIFPIETRQTSRPDRSTNKSCSICFDNIMESDMQMLPCAHGFHHHCIQRWTMENNSCPVCRHPLT